MNSTVGDTGPAAPVPAPSVSAPSGMVWLATVIAFAGAALYNFWVGLIIIMGDSYLLADRAKHLTLAGNLNLKNSLGGLIYPPLYPILISPAYFSGTPEISFQIILLLHSVFTASQVWPFYKLLTVYAKVPARAASWLAIALSLAPFTLPYASMVLTEVAYFPLVLWMTYFLLRAQQEDGQIRDWAAAGCFLGLMLLTRTAATTIVVALGGTALLSLWQARSDYGLLRRRAVGFGLSFLSFAVVFGSWKGFEKFFVEYDSKGQYFTSNDIRLIFSERERFNHHFAWLTNTFFYYLTAPLSIVGCFFYSLLFRRSRTLLRDPIVPFAVLSLAVSAITVVLVMAMYWGGRELTWNKYLAPYIFFIILIALRYRSWFNLSQLRTSALVLSLVFLASKPSGLGCHIGDALILFTANSNPYRFPESVANAIFAFSCLLPAYLWIANRPYFRAAATALTGVLWLASLAQAAFVYRNSGEMNVSAYKGAASKLLALSKQFPDSPVHYDPEFAQEDQHSALRILYYWPKLITALPFSQLPAVAAKSNVPVLYFTNKDVPGQSAIAEDRGRIRGYSLTAKMLSAPPPPLLPIPGIGRTFLKAVFAQNVPATESAKWQEKDYSVRWLSKVSEFSIANPGPAFTGSLEIDLGVATTIHTAVLERNGEVAPERPAIRKVLWVNGPQRVSFPMTFKQGLNTFKLSSPDKADVLPGGREVYFLQIGDVVAIAR